MASESNRLAAASVAYVNQVCRAWGWSWSETGQADDDGIDGLAYLRAMEVNLKKPNDRRLWKHQFTGGIIHVQIKSGDSYVVSETPDGIEIKISDLRAKREIWEKLSLPAALVYVKAERLGKTPSKAWWADLKSSDSYTTNGTIMIPRKNRFQAGLECLRPFSRLASGQHRRLSLEEIDMSLSGQMPSKLDHMSKGMKTAAWEFYRQWKRVGATHPDLGEVIVNRTGWSHITRTGRPLSRIQTSFELLPAAARIVENTTNWKVLRRGQAKRDFPDGSWAIYEYLGLSAMVKWPARASSEVMVVLRRQTILMEGFASDGSTKEIKCAGRKTWFYSVYEPGRRKGIK